MQDGISVVIPNYNGTHLFPHTLPTVFTALDHQPLPYEVIVVDDCSTDTSIAYLKKHYPQIRIVSNAVNSGFSITANRGVRESTYNKVLLLNSDVKLEADYFIHQLRYFQWPDTFGVMGRIVGWDDEIIQDGAKYPYFHGVKIKTSGNYLLENAGEMNEGLYSMYLSGANSFFNKQAFLDCGGLNELFSPFYVEDYELSLRAWRLHYKCYYEHRAVCRHKLSTSIKAKSRKRYVDTMYNRNKMFLHAIHLPRIDRYLYFLQLIPELMARVITGRLTYLASIWLFVSSYGEVRKWRKKLKRLAAGKGLYPVKEVANIIKDSVKDKNIVRF